MKKIKANKLKKKKRSSSSSESSTGDSTSSSSESSSSSSSESSSSSSDYSRRKRRKNHGSSEDSDSFHFLSQKAIRKKGKLKSGRVRTGLPVVRDKDWPHKSVNVVLAGKKFNANNLTENAFIARILNSIVASDEVQEDQGQERCSRDEAEDARTQRVGPHHG